MSSNQPNRLGVPTLMTSLGGTAWRNTTCLLLALAISACDQSSPSAGAAGGSDNTLGNDSDSAVSSASDNVASEAISEATQEKARVQLVSVAPQEGAEAVKTTSRVVEAADLSAFPGLSEFASVWGPAIASMAPTIAAQDHTGQPQTLASLAGERGLLLVFSRSADW